MRLHVLIALGISSALVLGTTALAQQPAPSTPPAASPGPAPVPPPDYGPPITNEQAKGVAIVGPAGELVYFEKMDGTQMASAKIAQGKARTAVMFRRPSKSFADQYAAGNTAFMTFPERPVASEGGVPIVVNGKIIGAVGASGGTGQQDGVAAAAGASAAK